MRLSRDENGSEAIEFALVAPFMLLVVFVSLYGLILAAANVSLAHASSVAVRYATIPVNPFMDVYPTTAQVTAKLHGSTPFFGANCTTTVTTTPGPNAPVVLQAKCPFPNPLGSVINKIGQLLTGAPSAQYPSGAMTVTHSAVGRRE